MNILVTGGAGFIGSHFVDFVLNQNKFDGSLVVLDTLTYAGNLDNLKSAINDPRFTFIKGDIANVEDVQLAIRGATHVVNFAAESHVDRSILDATEFIRTNVLGTQVLLDLSIQNRIHKFLQISTDEVYGTIDSGSWEEDSPLLPNSPYSASKAAADLLVRSYIKTHGLNANISRCSNNYGARQYPEKIIPFFIKLLKMNQKIPIYGNGLNRRDWLHVNDHCQALWLILTKGKSGEIYNIGGGVELTNLELATILLNKLKDGDLNYIHYVDDRKGHDFRYSVNWNKVKEQLGYQPQVDFKSGIELTISYYMAKDI